MVRRAITRVAQEYSTDRDGFPFSDWMKGLGDVRAQAKIVKAVAQMEAGNFGDHKAIKNGGGLYERRIHYGPGYRIYYLVEGSQLIILFAGSSKSDQMSTIQKALDYLNDYKRRKRSS
ncbi:hypothetical protein C9928_05745 [Pseudidiomarina aestuarii]|uniref:Addiction module protein n=2 Tax=Pseudidiomarina aestuarii TaxID=624146 RepID=A0A2T4CV06_9GAMM|nr:hypothetical protein C9986_01240 [Pseudidiomarina aestuarii]PTB85396.1 hypothetical protein C9988_01355 [Pseudidiomarina aestuarii]PTB88720.1 hypothetical protein C9928_05745 [Pseudidiomarina aestuarii]